MNPSDDCISCHMTTRSAQNFTHTIVTDHRIIARPNEPYPESGPAQPADGAKGLILVNRVPNEKSQPLPPDILLQAYDQLLASHPDNPQYQEQHRKLLDELAKTERDNPDVLRSLARVEAKKGTPGGLEAAIAYLQRAFTLGSVNPNDRVWLAQMLFDLRRGPEAVKELTEAIALSPYSPDYYRDLAVTYITDGKYRDGMEIINRAAQLFPESESIHVLQQRAQRLEPSFLSHAK
jgi:tetratricopeptide (TPR) repeat protein